MNFLDFVRKIKIVNRGKVCIVKSGIFYYALEKDALVLEKYCRLDKICFSVNICKVGFPVTSLEKYMNMLKVADVSFCVYDYLVENEECFLNSEIFLYNDKKYGKIFDYDVGEINYSCYVKDCFNCKFYEREIISNVSKLADTMDKYICEIEKFNEFQREKRNKGLKNLFGETYEGK